MTFDRKKKHTKNDKNTLILLNGIFFTTTFDRKKKNSAEQFGGVFYI